MKQTIHDGKLVELTYRVADGKSGHILTCVEFPLGYVHGYNEILAPSIHKELKGRSAGDVIEVPIDGNRIFGPRDESLVFTDRIENVPRFPVGHLVGELDKLAVLDGLVHQKMDAAKILTSPSS